MANSVKWHHRIENLILSRKYLAYLHQTNTVVFNILSAAKQTKFYLSSPNITKVTLFDYVIYSSADSRRINNIDKLAHSVDNGAEQMEFDLSDEGEDGEHNGAGLAEIPKIFPILDDFFRWRSTI